MIQSLYIKDFALIDELTVEFGKGLNILTGETGAGKSIIIGALNMVLGERADTDVIREGASKAVAEAVLWVGSHQRLQHVLAEQEIEWRDEIILRREIKASGSRAFINDTPVNIGLMKEVGDLLVDLHGQHDHQLLLKEEHHRSVVDAFPAVATALQAYQKQYKAVADTISELKQLQRRERELQEKLELFRFQFKELNDAHLSEEEEAEIQAEMHLLDHAEVLDQKAAIITELGSSAEVNVLDLLHMVEAAMEEMSAIEKEFEGYLTELRAARISMQEMIRFTERYRSTIEFNPLRLETLRQRLTDLRKLSKKYGRDISGLIQLRNELQHNLNLAENFDLEIEKLKAHGVALQRTLSEKALELRNARRSTGEQLAKGIMQELHQLGMEHARFEVMIEPIPDDKGWAEVDGQRLACTEFGTDHIRFFISTNKGESPKALAKIASGGEISRVMLAMKSILAQQQALPVMIFDEIDTGISGAVSEKVGKSMRRLAQVCQIIAITHQPQIASHADWHFKVKKSEVGDRTLSTLVKLDEEAHVREVAALMSGAELTQAGLSSARELIQKAQMA